MAGISTPIPAELKKVAKDDFLNVAKYAVDIHNNDSIKDHDTFFGRIFGNSFPDHLEFEMVLSAWKSSENDDYLVLVAKDLMGYLKTYGAIVHKDPINNQKSLKKFDTIFETSPILRPRPRADTSELLK